MLITYGTLVEVHTEFAVVRVPPAKLVRIPIGRAKSGQLRARIGFRMRIDIADLCSTPADYDAELWAAINHHTALLTQPPSGARVVDLEVAKCRIDAAVKAIRTQAQNETIAVTADSERETICM